jgi:hypothetical protein
MSCPEAALCLAVGKRQRLLPQFRRLHLLDDLPKALVAGLLAGWRRSQPLLAECSAGWGLQIALERKGSLAIREGEGWSGRLALV